MRRSQLLALVGLLVLAPARIRADVDLSGKWLVSSSFAQGVCLDLVQTGASLTATPCEGIEAPYAGSIDAMTGVFSISQPVSCPPGDYAAIDATATPDGHAFTGTITVTVYHCTFLGCDCFPFTDAISGSRERCGDAYLNLDSEQCDDGNALNGDCCSSTCTSEDGLVCNDGDAMTTDDKCAGGTCRGTPLPGTDFRVNTYTTAVQFWPAVGCNGAGQFVVSWDDFPRDGVDGAVIAQRYGSDGAPLGPEFRVNSYTMGQQADSEVALDASGNFIIVWSSELQEGAPGSGVFARRYASTGAPFGTEFLINTYTTGYQFDPDVAAAPGGEFVVVWSSDQLSPDAGQDGSDQGIFGQRFSSSGVRLGSEFQVNEYTTGEQGSPDVAMDASGNFTVVWQSSGQDGDQDGVFGQRYDSSGLALGSEFQVNTYTTGVQGDAAVAIDANAGLLVTWASTGQDGDDSGIFARRYGSNGLALPGEMQVNAYTTGPQRRPRITSAATGGVIVWDSDAQEGASFDVIARRYDVDWTPLGSEFVVNSSTSSYEANPDVCSDATGDFVVTWFGAGPGDTDGVFAKRFEFPDPQVLDHFKCYRGRDLRNPPWNAITVGTQDQITSESVVVRKLKYVCAPVDKNGEGVADPAQHLACYIVDGNRLAPRPSVEVSTQFQTGRFELKRPKLLCVPATKTLLP